MDDARQQLTTPVDPRGLRRICNDHDDGVRNWYVTLAYWDLARLTAAYTHGHPMQPDHKAVAKAAAAVGDDTTRLDAAASEQSTEPATPFVTAFKDVRNLIADANRTEPRGPDVTPDLSGWQRNLDEGVGLDELRWLAGLDPEPNGDEAAPMHSKPRAVAAPDTPPLNANFCTFATWTSLTLGRDIRNVELPRRLDRLSGVRLRHRATNLAIAARKTNNMELSKVLGLGQRVVLWEVGTGLYTMFVLADRLDELKAVKDLTFADFEPGERSFTDEATNAIASALESVLEKLLTVARPRGAAGLAQLRSKDLFLGLASYHLARRAALEDRHANRRWVAELILRGNLLIGAYEQRKVDVVLTYPVEEMATAFFLERSGVHAMERSGLGRWRQRGDHRLHESLAFVAEWWGRFFTDQVMVFWAGDELLRLGRDLPMPPGAATFHPTDLQDIQDHWLAMLLLRYDHSYGNGHGTQSRIWSVFDDRMNYIVNFMRSRAQTRAMWDDPFDPEEVKQLRILKPPKDHDEPMG